MIVALCGLIGSGKGAVADYLVEMHNFKQDSFAAPLKDAVSAVFGWDRAILEGDTNESREWREEIDTWWADRLNKQGLTPRWVLQNWGTDVLRNYFHDDLWIASFERRVANSNDSIVISDCRFPNELAALRKIGATIVRVKRGDDPDWFTAAAKINTLPALSPEARAAKIVLDAAKIHPSETSWAGQRFDLTIENDGTLAELYEKVEQLFR